MSLVTPNQQLRASLREINLESLYSLQLEKIIPKINFNINIFFPLSKIDFLESEKEMTVDEISKIITSLEQKDFNYLINSLKELRLTGNYSKIYQKISTIEEAFNIIKIITEEELLKRKFEDMQLNLIKIKQYSEALSVNADDVVIDKKLYQNIMELENKIVSSKYTHELLMSLGTNENDVMKLIKETALKF